MKLRSSVRGPNTKGRARKLGTLLHPKPTPAKGRVQKPEAAPKKRSKKRKTITNPPKNPNATLLGLPGELRNEIYAFVLTAPEPRPMDNIKLDKARLKEPKFLRVCKQIRNESAYIFYSAYEYTVEIRNFKFATLLKRLRKISEVGVKTLRFDHFYLNRTPNFNVEDLLSLVKGLAKIGVQLRDYSGDQLRLRCGGCNGFDCEDLLTMAEAAYEEGWAEHVVEDRFLQWLDGNEELQKKRKRRS